MANSTEIKLIAQAHAQNIKQQQNEKYMQMANNMIAEQQKNDNYLQMANDIIAQESQQTPQPQQVTQPVVQPVQQKTVTEVKKIPSIADRAPQKDVPKPNLDTFFKPKSASGRDINKEATESIQENKRKEREKTSPIGSGIEQIDLSKYNLPTENGFTEDDIKAFEDYDKAVAWTQPDYRLTKEEQKEAKRIARQGIERLEKPTENTTGAPVYVGRSVKDMTPEEQKEYQMYKDLELRSNGLASFAVGAADKLLQQGESLANTQLQLSKKYGDLFAKLGIISPEEAEMATEALDNARQSVKDFDRDYVEDGRSLAQGAAPIASPTIPILNQQVDITPYGTGQMGTQMAEYFLTNPVFDALGDAAKVGKAGKFLINQAGQNLQDLLLDTSFVVQNALDDGTISEDEAKEIKSNMAWNAAFNLGLGALGEIPGLVKKVANNRAAKKNAQAIAGTVDNAVKEIPGIDNVTDIYKGVDNYSVDTARNVDNELENSGNFRKNSLDNVNTSVYDNNVDNVRYTDNGGVEYGRNAVNRTGNSPDTYEPNTIREEVSGSLSQSGRFGQRDSGISEVSILNKETRDKMTEAGITNFGLRDYSDNYKAYSDGLSKGRATNPYGVFVDNQSVEHLEEEGAKAFMSDNGATGLAVLNNGDIVGVYKNGQLDGRKGAVKDLLITARENGGNRLDCYGAKLVNGYSEAGFEPVARVPYEYGINDEMDAFCKSQKAKNPKFKEPDIYFMKVRDGESIDSTIDNIKNASFPLYDKKTLDSLPEMSYDEAAKYRDSLIDMNLQHFAEQPKQGAFFDGVNDTMKERGLSKHIVGEDTPMKMEDVSDEVVADFKDDPDMYKVLTNAETKAKAERIYRESSNAEAQFRRLLAQKDPAALPLGHQLAKDYSAAGNHEAAAEIYRAMGEELTKAGQFSQAAAINMMKNDPMTALRYAERQIDNLNQTGKQRFGAKWKDFELTDAERQLFNSIAPGDEEAIKSAFDQIGARIGKDYPTTLMDKLLEGRKIAMLFNVRTNVRNFGANVPTLGLRWMADRVEALGQNAAHLINPDVKVTQSLTGSGIEGRKLATEVFNSKKVQALLNDAPGKYEIPDLKNSLTQNKQMYKGTAFEKWIDNVTDGGIQKINSKLFGKEGVQSGLETIRNATYKLLDLGDSPFVKENFVERLGSYINAQGIKNIDDVPDEAIQMAWEEALKATYKDNSWAVQMLSGLKGGIEKIPGVGRPLSQAAIPFLQAPGNIAARMIDYSPIKATKGIADIVAGATKNDAKTISKGIEEAAKGLTGTGLILLGMRLRDSGILTGTYSKDKDQKAFEKQNGFREFALHVGNKYFTYDWAQPFAEPLIIGTLLADAINKSDEYNSDLLTYFGVDNPIANKALGVATEGAKASLNSWFNASPLQGLQELLSGGYNGTDIAQNIIDTGVSDFAGAFVPATVNAVAKSVDTTQRNTYDPSNRVSTFVNQQIAKIPGLSKTLPAKYDTWGNEMKYADSQAMATASRFVVPGDYSYDRENPTDKEINRLFEATNDTAVFPQVAPNKVGDKKLNNKDISVYQQDMGTRSRELVENFMDSETYKSMDDSNKAETISNLYGVSKAITERDKFDKEPADNSKYKKAIAAYDEAGGGEAGAKAVVDYYTTKAMTDEAGLSANSNAAKSIQEDVQNGNMDAAQEKIDAAQQLPTLGLDKPGPVYTYYNAQKQIPGLTVEDFATTYKAIDTDKNQGIKQDEVIDYLNKNKITSQSEANEIWSAYGNSEWKYIPSIKDGVWTKKKK